MGTLTLDNIKDELRESMGGRNDVNSRLERIINLAQMRIARVKKGGWEELDKTYDTTLSIAGTVEQDKLITLQSTLRDITSFRIIVGSNQSRKLTYVPIRKWDEVIPEPEYYARGKPTLYTIQNNVAEIWRVPDVAYRAIIRTKQWPTTLSTAGQTSDLDNKDDLIINLSLSWIFNSQSKMDEAGRFWTIYSAALNEATGEDDEKIDQIIMPDFNLHTNFDTEYWRDPFMRVIPK